jgi:hypothetical protein
MSAWPTPKDEDSESTGAHRGTPDTLTSAARVSWATPTVSDASMITKREVDRVQSSEKKPAKIPVQAFGMTFSGSPAETAKAGQLNPRFSLWLQGYSTGWASCGERVIRSFHKSRKPSSKRI